MRKRVDRRFGPLQRTLIKGFFSELNDSGTLEETRLWRSTIDRALMDFTLPCKPSLGPSVFPELVEKKEVSCWFGTEDFVDVCTLANLDENFVRRSFNLFRTKIKEELEKHPIPKPKGDDY